MMHDEAAIHSTTWEVFITFTRALQTQLFWTPDDKIDWQKLMDNWVKHVFSLSICT